MSNSSAWHRHMVVVAAALSVWGLMAYLLVPEVWYRYESRHPALEGAPTITHTADGIPGDPLNIAAVGSENQLKSAMIAARWYPADPLTLKSCLEIAEATVLDRPYAAAPVSNLFLFSRKEDLAFERPVGDNPRKRHHVRFWKSGKSDAEGRPVWLGAATYDDAVGLSHTTGQITHHISGNVDAERDGLIQAWRQAGRCSDVVTVRDFQKTKTGRNGGGDHWQTDGLLKVGMLVGP